MKWRTETAPLAALLAIIFAIQYFVVPRQFSFRKFEGRTWATTNVEGAQNALEARLPVGSDIQRYAELFYSVGGECEYISEKIGEPKDGLYCNYSHGFLVMSEWHCFVKYNMESRKSKSISVSFGLTGL